MQDVEDLAQLHRQGLDLAAALPADDLARQYHPDLSPVGWHVGHCAFVENYWLREVVLDEAVQEERLHALYFPENSRKSRRGDAIPARERLLQWAARVHGDNRALLADPPAHARRHRLMRGGYLLDFLAQHYAQHLETMECVLVQRALAADDRFEPDAQPEPRAPRRDSVPLAAGTYTIGDHGPGVYDNECPAHEVRLGAAALSRHPVTQAELLAFVTDGGYERPGLWSEAGWQWRCARGIERPVFWRRSAGGRWYARAPAGPRPLDADAPAAGLSWWEAEAFARWAGARLPHEYEWEALARAQALQGTGRVWEWCANPLHPYPGFRAFPYDGYSTPWFDGNHYVLRGGSEHTHGAVRRPTFRNFHEPDKRHLLAGVRLAW